MKKKTCVSLDMKMTGHILNQLIRKHGYTVSDIQRELRLSCPQSIYRWINGQALPSIDNLYRLSALLEVHMEEMILPRQDEVWFVQKPCNPERGRRLTGVFMTFHGILPRRRG